MFGLYEVVSYEVFVFICVYENFCVINFIFSDDLYCCIGKLLNIGVIKIFGILFVKSVMDNSFSKDIFFFGVSNSEGVCWLVLLWEIMFVYIVIGVSGDSFGVVGMSEGCDFWFFVIGGIFLWIVMCIIDVV